MAPGVKSKTKRSRPTNLKSQKMTRPLPAHNLQILPSSSNRFSVLAGLNDMETSPDSNSSVDKQSKPSPIVVEHYNNYLEKTVHTKPPQLVQKYSLLPMKNLNFAKRH
mgnify:CR=1 FL=1